MLPQLPKLPQHKIDGIPQDGSDPRETRDRRTLMLL